MIDAVLMSGTLLLLLAWLKAIASRKPLGPQGRKAGNPLPDNHHNGPQDNPERG